MAKLDLLRSWFARQKAAAEARQSAEREGRLVTPWDPAELAKGCPGVRLQADFQGVAYSVRSGRWFGWFWLAFTSVHCFFMFKGFSAGKVTVNGSLVAAPPFWALLLLGLFYVPFFLVGFAFTLARYQVVLAPDKLLVRWRVLPYVGWTWSLATGEQVEVRLAFRGAKSNNRPVDAIVVSSQGREVDFGAFLDEKKKAYLAAAIRDYYDAGESPAQADFIA
jgi:hypothetical protein